MVTLVKPVQPENAPSPIDVTLFGIVMLVRLVQLAKPFTLVTPFCMVTLVKPVQRLNAEPPIDITLLGIVMLVKPVQSENAERPILVTLFGIVMLVRPVQWANARGEIVNVPALIVYCPDTVDLTSIKCLPIYSAPFSQLDSFL